MPKGKYPNVRLYSVFLFYWTIVKQIDTGCGSAEDKRTLGSKAFKATGRNHEIESMLKELKRQHSCEELSIPEDLCWLYGSVLDDYLHDVEICQNFARKNREMMAENILERSSLTAEESFHTVQGYLFHPTDWFLQKNLA